MSRLVLALIIYSYSFQLFSQNKSDLGLAFGGSYYMGDINPTIPFYSPSISGGLVYRYNMNKRYVLKAEANYLQLRASDAGDPYRLGRKNSFSSILYDISGQFEFNFLPLTFEAQKFSFSPFISTGAALSFTKSNGALNVKPVFPFAMGIKTAIGRRWCLGTQWNFRKTFDDNLDKVQNQIEPKYISKLNNNDWYSYAGIFITYKLFDFTECPAYQSSF